MALARAIAEIEYVDPTIAETRKAALVHAGLWGEQPKWEMRARAAGWIPRISLRASRSRGDDEDYTRSSAGTEKLGVGSDIDVDYEARADWDLDRVVFDDAEIRAAQAKVRLHQARLQIAAEVTAIYFKRRKLQIALVQRRAARTQTTTPNGRASLPDCTVNVSFDATNRNCAQSGDENSAGGDDDREPSSASPNAENPGISAATPGVPKSADDTESSSNTDIRGATSPGVHVQNSVHVRTQNTTNIIVQNSGLTGDSESTAVNKTRGATSTASPTNASGSASAPEDTEKSAVDSAAMATTVSGSAPSPSTEVSDLVTAIEIDELTAQLDALTGGYFSRARTARIRN